MAVLGLSCLRHYDALPTKLICDPLPPPYYFSDAHDLLIRSPNKG